MAAAPESSNRNRVEGKVAAPFFVHLFNPLGRRLASAGLMGPNILLTVPGRKSGRPRTTPVAMVQVDGRRWIIGTFGAVGWVHNLRAARRATVTVRGRREQVEGRELSPAEGAQFFRAVLAPYVTGLPIGRLILKLLGASDILTDPQAAAARRPVFELQPLSRSSS